MSGWAIPLILGLVGTMMLMPGSRSAEAFAKGARGGMETTVRLLPTLLLLTVGVSMLRASGCLSWIGDRIAPLFTPLGIPGELISFLLVRPVSGSAGMAMAAELMEQYGADSRVGVTLSLLMATSDTMGYVIPVYMAAGKIRHSRHAFPCAAVATLIATALCCLAGKWMFG